MYLRVLIGAIVILEILLGISPKTDRLTWALENTPVWVGVVLLWLTRKRFPLTHLCYALFFVHAIILMIGGYYSYAHTPIFSWIRDTFGLERNYYDRLGHVAQGFVPAIVWREVLFRTSTIGRGCWLPFLCICVCLAGSALFELWEWRTAVIFGAGSVEYLGSQGDIWDAQWDMTCALIGATLSLLLLSREHDRELKAMGFS